MAIRFSVEPGDVPPAIAARRLGLTLEQFETIKAQLIGNRGFPPPDPDTGNYCLEAIDAWRRARFPQLLGLTHPQEARDAREIIRERRAAAARG